MADYMEGSRNKAAANALGNQTPDGLESQVGAGIATLMEDMKVSEGDLQSFMAQQGGAPNVRDAAEQLMRSKVAEKYPDYSQEQIDSLFADVSPKAEQPEAKSQEKEFETAQGGADEKTRQNQGQANQSAVPASYKDRLNQMFQVYK